VRKMVQETINVMKKISLEKIVLNIGVGKSGDVIEVSKKALQQITTNKPNTRNAKDAHRDWGVRKGEPIGVAVTIRGTKATEVLKRLLEAKDNQVKGRSFDDFGNFSFGILEHINIPGVKYDPEIGILGLDVSVTLTRPGFAIRVRRKHKSSVGNSHRISSNDAKEFVKKEFGVNIV